MVFLRNSVLLSAVTKSRGTRTETITSTYSRDDKRIATSSSPRLYLFCEQNQPPNEKGQLASDRLFQEEVNEASDFQTTDKWGPNLRVYINGRTETKKKELGGGSSGAAALIIESTNYADGSQKFVRKYIAASRGETDSSPGSIL